MNKGLKLVFVIFTMVLLCACGKSNDEAEKTEDAWNVYTYSETENGGSTSSKNDYSVSGEEELSDLLKNADTELQLPSYVPEGYGFEEGDCSYFVTRDSLAQAQVREDQEEDGGTVYIYTLPDSVLKQLDGFRVTYSNGEGKKITIEASYVQSMDMDTGNLNFEETKASGYDLGRSGSSNNGYLGEFFREAQPVYGYEGGSEIEKKVVFVRIWMSDTDREEVVRIAESM